MEPRTPLEIVDAYLEAIAKHDLGRARSLLSDIGFEYLSPINRFASADEFIAYMELASPIVQRVVTRKVFVDGDELCHFLQVTSQISEKRSTAVAQWSQVTAGKITRLELVFDAHEYKSLLVGE